MLDKLDRRVLSEAIIDLVRTVQRREPCHLAGGAALAGAHLAHRLSADVDLFVHEADAHGRVCRHLRDAVEDAGGTVVVIQDARGFWRGRVSLADETIEFDVVHESVPDIEEPPPPIEGIVVESLTDLRAAKLTCLLSRSEPRDLVDILFLERAGYPPEHALELALQKDAGMDPGTLAWLLKEFPVEPLPKLLVPLTADELRTYRDELAQRFRQLALPK